MSSEPGNTLECGADLHQWRFAKGYSPACGSSLVTVRHTLGEPDQASASDVHDAEGMFN